VGHALTLTNSYASRRCSLLLYPGAFNMTTGPLHWELLVRSRALDSQLWVAAVCCARDATAGYVAYGHSMLVGPMGNVVEQAQEHAAIVEGVVNVQQCVEVRWQSVRVLSILCPPLRLPTPSTSLPFYLLT
jgi:omega-amidase